MISSIFLRLRARALHGLKPHGTVLSINQQPVESTVAENLGHVRVSELDEGSYGVFSFAEFCFEPVFHSELKYVFSVFVSLEKIMEWDLINPNHIITFVMSAFPIIELENNLNQPNSKDHNPKVGSSNLPPRYQAFTSRFEPATPIPE